VPTAESVINAAAENCYKLFTLKRFVLTNDSPAIYISKWQLSIVQGSHYILILKFNQFSRTFKDPEVAVSRTNSRRTFAARTVLQQYLISISVIKGQF